MLRVLLADCTTKAVCGRYIVSVTLAFFQEEYLEFCLMIIIKAGL